MTDAFEVQGDFSPAQTSDFSPAETFVDAAEPVAAEPALPNGFVKLGLAAELLRAVPAGQEVCSWLICTRAFQRRYGLGIARPAPVPVGPPYLASCW